MKPWIALKGFASEILSPFPTKVFSQTRTRPGASRLAGFQPLLAQGGFGTARGVLGDGDWRWHHLMSLCQAGAARSRPRRSFLAPAITDLAPGIEAARYFN